jgi:hypothetical protein
MDDSWVKPYQVGPYVVMFSKAPFLFSRFLPTLRWKSFSWRRYEFKIIRMMPAARKP